MRLVVFFGGVLVAALGGAMLYRTLFLESPSAYLVTETHIRELPNTARLAIGAILLVAGALVAFFSVKRVK